MYGIANHINGAASPIEVVLHQEAEKIDACYSKRVIDRFIDLDVNKHSGITLTEFKQLSIHDARYVIKRVRNKLDAESKAANEASKKLNNP